MIFFYEVLLESPFSLSLPPSPLPSTNLSGHVEQVGELALLALWPSQVLEETAVTHVLSDDQDRLLRTHCVQRQKTLVSAGGGGGEVR